MLSKRKAIKRVEETNPRSNKRLSLLPNDKNRETHLLTKSKEKEKVKRKVCKPGQEGKRSTKNGMKKTKRGRRSEAKTEGIASIKRTPTPQRHTTSHCGQPAQGPSRYPSHRS